MFKIILLAGLLMVAAPGFAAEQRRFEGDVVKTSVGDLEMIFVGHGSLIFKFDGKVIHVDPYSKLADYSTLLKADLILITHDHRDHLDLDALMPIRTQKTIVILPEACASKLEGGTVMKNGDVQTVLGIKIEAIPAYNLVHKRDSGEPFHVKGVGNGYILTFGERRVYVAGDTENIPEMKALKGIDCAFLPMNLPYTMTPEMVADAARAFRPNILYPYHYGDTDVSRLVDMLKNDKDIEVRVRSLQ